MTMRMRRMSWTLIAAALMLLLPVLASPAARAAPPPGAAPGRVQRLSFEDDVVTGFRDLGEGDVVGPTRPAKHSSLVRARESFVPELIKSAEDI